MRRGWTRDQRAARSSDLPVNTAFRSACKSIFGLSLLAECFRLGVNDPADCGQVDLALARIRGVEQFEIEQWISLGRQAQQ